MQHLFSICCSPPNFKSFLISNIPNRKIRKSFRVGSAVYQPNKKVTMKIPPPLGGGGGICEISFQIIILSEEIFKLEVFVKDFFICRLL